MDEPQGIEVQNASSEPQQQEVAEKMLKQSEVNDLLGKAKHAAFEKGKREGLEAAKSQGGSLGGMPNLTEEQVRQIYADEVHKQNQINNAQRMLDSFVSQMNTGKGKYSDFDETIAQLGPLQNMTHLVQLAHDTGIGGDVMYELGKNPNKVATLTTLSYINPALAKTEMNKLADSIRKNEVAAKVPQAQEPLGQITPSTVSTDNGVNTVRDLRRKAWARA